MPLSSRVYPVITLCTLGALATGAACTTFVGVGDVGQGGAGGQGAGGAPTGAGGGKASSSAAGPGVSSTQASSGSGTPASSSAAGPSSSSSGGPASSASSSSAASSSSSGGPVNDASQICVDAINKYRATLNLPPYARWGAEESCAATQGMKDYQSMTAHSAFGMCSEWAQNECPGWPGPPEQMITQCLAQMWAEGPGPFNQGHGHYINMSSTSYTKVACGFYTTPQGQIWAVQDFQ